MATYTYTSHNITSVGSIASALSTLGDNDPSITLDTSGELIITTSLTQEQTDAVVSDSADGSLLHNKYIKKQEVFSNSSSLLELGVKTWNGKYVPCTKSDVDNYWTDHEFFTSNPSLLGVSKPYYIETIEEHVFDSTANISDINQLVLDCYDRLVYLYTSGSNSDGSFSEGVLIALIDAAPDQAALDLIIDTRK